MEHIEIDIRVLAHGRDLPLPTYATDGAAGMDLQAAIDQPIELAPGERRAVPTGLQIAVPSGYEAQIRPRSGWALKRGITVANAPGTIDSDYRGEVLVALVNLNRQPQEICRGDCIAQMVIAPVVQAAWNPVEACRRPGVAPEASGRPVSNQTAHHRFVALSRAPAHTTRA